MPSRTAAFSGTQDPVELVRVEQEAGRIPGSGLPIVAKRYGEPSKSRRRRGRRLRRYLRISRALLEEETDREPGRAAAEVGGVVDHRRRAPQEDVQPGPEDELHEERFGLRGEVLPPLAQEGDEGPHDAEDGSRGADAGHVPPQDAGD